MKCLVCQKETELVKGKKNQYRTTCSTECLHELRGRNVSRWRKLPGNKKLIDIKFHGVKT